MQSIENKAGISIRELWQVTRAKIQSAYVTIVHS